MEGILQAERRYEVKVEEFMAFFTADRTGTVSGQSVNISPDVTQVGNRLGLE